MVIATGPNVRILYQEETTRGTKPAAPDMDILRTTGRNINLVKNILESAEVRGTRQKKEVRHGLNSVVGSIPFELSRANYDDWIYYVLGDDAATDATPGPLAWNVLPAITDTISLGAGSPTATITRASGDFLADGWRPGFSAQIAQASNGANNTTWMVLSLTATVLTVADPDGDMVTEVAATADLVVSYFVESGTTLKTLTIERGFSDAVQFQPFLGCAINGMTLSIQPEAIVGGTFDILGMSADAASGTSLDSTPNATTPSSPFDAFSGVLIAGDPPVLQTAVTGLDLNIVNGRSVVGVVGKKISPDVFEGQHVVTGTLTAFFEDATLLNHFINESPFVLAVRLDDPNAVDFHSITMTDVKYTGAEMDPPAEGPVPLSLPFQALEDTNAGVGATIAWQKSGPA